MKGPEAKLQRKIRDALKTRFGNIFAIKVHGGPLQKRGLPDIIGCYRGKFIALEVKVPGREANLTDSQKAVMLEIREAGGLAEMVTSSEQALGVVGCYVNSPTLYEPSPISIS